MRKITFITPTNGRYGFSLAGVPQYTAEAQDAEEMLRKTMTEPETGLVVIDERLIKGMSEERMRELEQTWQGTLLVLPAPEKFPAEVEDYAARLIRRAIGYHVRLKL
ncbi:MAG TPA: V-type ATP synthase subunit F [Thermodesulfovibrionales bacterium]|nr:V-type ATP synthase subunit F [Thermodesulfovibrionales bacterium]